MLTLKPCPFCGSDDIDVMPNRVMAPDAKPPVYCANCLATAQDAEAWNLRVKEASPC